MKKYSDDDLVRKPIARIAIWGIGLFSVIVGSKHIAFNGLNWKGSLVGLFGVFLLVMLNKAYEDLLKEKCVLVAEGEENE